MRKIFSLDKYFFAECIFSYLYSSLKLWTKILPNISHFLVSLLNMRPISPVVCHFWDLLTLCKCLYIVSCVIFIACFIGTYISITDYVHYFTKPINDFITSICLDLKSPLLICKALYDCSKFPFVWVYRDLSVSVLNVLW